MFCSRYCKKRRAKQNVQLNSNEKKNENWKDMAIRRWWTFDERGRRRLLCWTDEMVGYMSASKSETKKYTHFDPGADVIDGRNEVTRPLLSSLNYSVHRTIISLDALVQLAES